MKIAICITTRNRPEAFARTYANWLMHLPADAKIFVVDDCSDKQYVYADFRFSERAGIPKAKNKCFELAYKWGADYIFLSDDDCFPIVDNWFLPYIESGINHLCYTFTSGWEGTPSWSKPIIKNGFNIHTLGCGCMMFFTRKCLDIVGGFDEAFGLGKYEHAEMSRRIHNAGLTPHKFMDVIGSELLFHSMDKHGEVVRTFTNEEQTKLMNEGSTHFWENQKSRKYISFVQD